MALPINPPVGAGGGGAAKAVETPMVTSTKRVKLNIFFCIVMVYSLNIVIFSKLILSAVHALFGSQVNLFRQVSIHGKCDYTNMCVSITVFIFHVNCNPRYIVG